MPNLLSTLYKSLYKVIMYIISLNSQKNVTFEYQNYLVYELEAEA